MLKPINNRVLIKPKEKEEKVGSLILTGNNESRVIEGIVLATGPGKALNDGDRFMMSVAEGDRVLFNKYAAQEVTVDGEDCYVIFEDDLYGILE